MRKTSLIVFVWVVLLQTAGCTGPKNLVVLVPDPDGSTGSISVSNEAGKVLIEAPYHLTNIKDRQSVPTPPAAMEKGKVKAIFSMALAAQPEPPVHFLLYMEKGSPNLTADSMAQISRIIDTIRTRNAHSVSVIGHTDTLGDKDTNLKLSAQRADSVSRLLIEKGVDAEKIETTSHGEENPLVKTGDNVSEPRNRRVEVIVR